MPRTATHLQPRWAVGRVDGQVAAIGCLPAAGGAARARGVASVMALASSAAANVACLVLAVRDLSALLAMRTSTSRERIRTAHGRTQRVFDAEHLDVAESHQQLTRARRVNFHRDPPSSRLLVSVDSGGSLAFSRGPLLPPHFRRATNPRNLWTYQPYRCAVGYSWDVVFNRCIRQSEQPNLTIEG